MNVGDTATKAEQFVLKHWHTFGGGVVIGAVGVLLLQWIF